jgi:two-component sensor histidine kinase
MALSALLEPSIADVFAIDALAKRPAKKFDYLQEKHALQDLAARMVDQPEDMLPRFVDLAMEMTGGVSAGLSLYEENPAPGVFRWQYLRGILAPFNGATTPRNFSPCGVTLDHNGPVLSIHPERVYNWISDANIVVPEVLLVPLYLDGVAPLGTLWIVSDKENHFDSGHARAMTELATFVGIAVRMVRSEQRLQQALEQQETLTREMGHRINNLFAITDGMIRTSARTAGSKDELAETLSGRMHALAIANGLIRRDFNEAAIAPGASDLRELVETILAPYDHDEKETPLRFTVEGPLVPCGDRATNGIALICHELATNAAKYGALKVAEGRVAVTWRREDDMLILRWVESGGPIIDAPPVKTGFGSSLAQTTAVRQFRGTLDCDWSRGGLAVTITLPINGLSA